jgi:hypothetical protein
MGEQMMPTRTELIWDGKYDAEGKRVAPLRVALPFQNVETINETAQERNRNLFQHAAQEQPWRNRLIWGDKKYVLPSLLPEFAGKVNLIYIDPPFDTGADFSFTATVPEHEDDDDSLAFTKEPSIIEQKAYRDTWGRGLDSYLQWFYETVVILHELLAEDGSIYVHLDYHIGHYAKIILDEVFGLDKFKNEIVWKRSFWTREAVAEWAARELGVKRSRWVWGRWLAAKGFTPQKPARRAYEHDPAAVERWLTTDYPRIQAEARAENAEIHWLDEAGLRSDCQHGRGYAPKGQTPVQPVPGKRFGVNYIATLTNLGVMRFMVFAGRFTATVLPVFLTRLLASRATKV